MSGGAWYLGNQEDSVILNKGAIDRGMFWATTYKTHTVEECKQSVYNMETIGLPPLNKRRGDINYSLLDTNGIIRERYPNGQAIYVESGDVLIGKVLIQGSKSGEEELSDVSLVVKQGEEGYIDRVIISTMPNGYKLAKVVIRKLRIPEMGDKLCSRCYHPDTEILTQDGWKAIAAITTNDRVATLQSSSTLVYANPLETQTFPYQGDMYSLETPEIALCVTPNHRMWVSNVSGSNQNFKIQEANEIVGKPSWYTGSVDKTQFSPTNHFMIPGYHGITPLRLSMDSWCAIFGRWVHAHGKEDWWFLSQGDGDNIPWWVLDPRVRHYLKLLPKDQLPTWCMFQSLQHSAAIIKGIFHNSTQFQTKSITLKDQIQQLALHAGCTCIVTAETRDKWILRLSSSQNQANSNGFVQDKMVHYNGLVHCCTVPGDGIIMVRRNGKPVWCGNSAQKGTCVAGNTLVSTTTGLSTPIKDIEIGTKLWGYKYGEGLQMSTCTNKAYMGSKRTLKLTICSGEELVCTEDHRIMTNSGWKEAKELDPNDLIMYNIPMPQDIPDKDELDWILTMSYQTKSDCYERLTLTMDSDHERQRTLAFARILGYIVSAGWSCTVQNSPPEYRAAVAFGTAIDTQGFINDIATLLDCTKVSYNTTAKFYGSEAFKGICYLYELPLFLSRCIASLPGLVVGKRTIQKPSYPSFLETAPLSIIREFIGGLLGGDSKTLSLVEDAPIEFLWKSLEEHQTKLRQHMESLRYMLERLEVPCTSLPLKTINSSRTDIQNRVLCGIHIDDIATFIDKIGIRYHIENQSKLLAIATWSKIHSFVSSSEKPIVDWRQCTHIGNFLDQINPLVHRGDKGIPYMYIPIHGIEEYEPIDVYDITVKDIDSFVANGMIVHNCGMILPTEDMPRTAEGIIPDLLLNPQALKLTQETSNGILVLVGYS
jgi:hypothetical protein